MHYQGIRSLIAGLLDVKEDEISNIEVIKKGMTNNSFTFDLTGERYIIRMPGEGTSKLINRKQEAEVYGEIEKYGLCDDLLFINSDNGIKITKFYTNARVCNSKDQKDVVKCMNQLKKFHNLRIEVKHDFDLIEQINYYESLWGDIKSAYTDYEFTKERALQLYSFIENNIEEKVLAHIDAVPDNFLFVDNKASEIVKLIDWEYSGMQDPHIDIAMFAIYSMYNKEEIDKLIDIYFDNKCSEKCRVKIYCYVSLCGLLWSNWCEYKKIFGIDFGEYADAQYKYAKDYCEIAKSEIDKRGW